MVPIAAVALWIGGSATAITATVIAADIAINLAVNALLSFGPPPELTRLPDDERPPRNGPVREETWHGLRVLTFRDFDPVNAGLRTFTGEGACLEPLLPSGSIVTVDDGSAWQDGDLCWVSCGDWHGAKYVTRRGSSLLLDCAEGCYEVPASAAKVHGRIVSAVLGTDVQGLAALVSEHGSDDLKALSKAREAAARQRVRDRDARRKQLGMCA